MSIKKKVIEQSIKKAEKRVAHLESLIYANPASEIIGLRQELAKKLETHEPSEIIDWITESSEKEKKLFRLHKRQMKESTKWMDEQAKITCELSQLYSELRAIEIKESRA